MKYCLAVDVAKDKSCLGFFVVKDLTKGKDGLICLVPPEDCHHVREELDRFLRKISPYPKEEIAVVMESTGIYHLPLRNFFTGHGYNVIVINPLVSNRSMTSLRKTKTDKADVFKIALCYFKGECNAQYNASENYEEIRQLSRNMERRKDELAMKKMVLRNKLLLSAPAYEKIFLRDRLFAPAVLNLIRLCPHADDILLRRRDVMVNAMAEKGHSIWKERYEGQVTSLKEKSRSLLVGVRRKPAVIEEIRRLTAEIDSLENEIRSELSEALPKASSLPLFAVLTSFCGIGSETAFHLTAEFGDFARFRRVSSVTAYAGLDPSTYESGRTLDANGSITKRGNPHLRKWLYCAVSSIIMHERDSEREFTDYYHQKRGQKNRSGQTHHHFYAMTACCNKLIHKIYYRYKDAIRNNAIQA